MILSFRYSEKYYTLLDTEVSLKYMNVTDELHVYSALYKGYTTVLFCGIKKWDNEGYTIYYNMKYNATEDLRLYWDNNCYIVYEGKKYTSLEKLYAALENKKNLAILDNYLQ